jgi:hypothetical protein
LTNSSALGFSVTDIAESFETRGGDFCGVLGISYSIRVKRAELLTLLGVSPERIVLSAKSFSEKPSSREAWTKGELGYIRSMAFVSSWMKRLKGRLAIR